MPDTRIRTNDKETQATTQETQTTSDSTETVCPEWGGSLATDEIHGETVCETCGLVVDEDSIDHGPEWRAFNPQEKDEKSRIGAPTTMLITTRGYRRISAGRTRTPTATR